MTVDTRRRTPGRRHRVLTVLALIAGASAVVSAVLAFTVLKPSAGVVLDPEPATLAIDTPAPTVLPSPEPETVVAPTATPTRTPAPPTPQPTATPRPKPRIPPAELTIDALGISDSVRPVGLEESGAMEVPGVTEIGWYLHGAVPGRAGATVLVAHVWWGDTPGPFHALGSLEPGAPVEVGLDDGTTHHYTVVERAVYDKYALPDNLWRNSGPETLVLITCGGDFDRATNRYEDNIVVYAVPNEAEPAMAGPPSS